MVRGLPHTIDMLLPLFSLLLASTVVARTTDLTTDIEEHVRAYPTGKPNVINVTVNTPVLGSITAAAPLNGLPDSLNKTEVFYKALGCEAADWMLNEINEFVRWSEIFDNGEDRYWDENEDDFYTRFTNLAASIHDNVGRLTSVLTRCSGRLSTGQVTRTRPCWRRCSRCKWTCIFYLPTYKAA